VECLLLFCSRVLFSYLIFKNLKVKAYRTIILPVVLYGYETWSLTLREEHGLRSFKNRVVRRIFGHKREEAVGKWRRLHNEELCNLYASPNIIKIIKLRSMPWTGCLACLGEMRNA
jgi:hypothetical protein